MGIFGVKTHWIIGQKSQNSARYAGAFWGKITFFGRKVNKVPCIIGIILGKMNFLGIFGVKTRWIIGQKSQNRARYAGAFWGKITFFWRKDNKVPCIIDVIWGKFNFLGISVVKTHCVIGQKSPNSAQYAVTFWRNSHFFGRKVNKVPCIIFEIWGKLSFWDFFS